MQHRNINFFYLTYGRKDPTLRPTTLIIWPGEQKSTELNEELNPKVNEKWHESHHVFLWLTTFMRFVPQFIFIATGK